jgi:hypothetical protein
MSPGQVDGRWHPRVSEDPGDSVHDRRRAKHQHHVDLLTGTLRRRHRRLPLGIEQYAKAGTEPVDELQPELFKGTPQRSHTPRTVSGAGATGQPSTQRIGDFVTANVPSKSNAIIRRLTTPRRRKSKQEPPLRNTAQSHTHSHRPKRFSHHHRSWAG